MTSYICPSSPFLFFSLFICLKKESKKIQQKHNLFLSPNQIQSPPLKCHCSNHERRFQFIIPYKGYNFLSWNTLSDRFESLSLSILPPSPAVKAEEGKQKPKNWYYPEKKKENQKERNTTRITRKEKKIKKICYVL